MQANIVTLARTISLPPPAAAGSLPLKSLVSSGIDVRLQELLSSSQWLSRSKWSLPTRWSARLSVRTECSHPCTAQLTTTSLRPWKLVNESFVKCGLSFSRFQSETASEGILSMMPSDADNNSCGVKKSRSWCSHSVVDPMNHSDTNYWENTTRVEKYQIIRLTHWMSVGTKSILNVAYIL